MKHFAKQFTANTNGRDFVIGDLHGCFSRLKAFMEFINFDEQTDRIFSVGDLIDRGPASLDCLRLKNKPWFNCVYANHEELANAYLEKETLGMWWFPNGGNWWYSLDELEKLEVRDLIGLETPVLITVDLVDDRKFHVIHAELYETEELDDENLITDIEGIATVQCRDGDCIIWGRALFLNLYDKHLDERTISKYRKTIDLEKLDSFMGPDLSHIYSGHSVMRQPVTIGKQTNLDTGAYKSYQEDTKDCYGLTITEPLTGKFWLSNASGVKENECVNV